MENVLAEIQTGYKGYKRYKRFKRDEAAQGLQGRAGRSEPAVCHGAADEASADYSDVGEALASWRESGVLLRDDEPRYYVMRQRFTAPSGAVLERIGFFAELGLEDYSERVVRPHERTLAGPKADRLKVLRASRANLSSVFLLYQDKEQRLEAVLARALEVSTVAKAQDDSGVEYTLATPKREFGVEDQNADQKMEAWSRAVERSKDWIVQ